MLLHKYFNEPVTKQALLINAKSKFDFGTYKYL